MSKVRICTTQINSTSLELSKIPNWYDIFQIILLFHLSQSEMYILGGTIAVSAPREVQLLDV